MNESILLTDSNDPSIGAAASLLDGWRADYREPVDLSAAIAEPGVRALLITTRDPSDLRASMESAHARGLPVIVGCDDETARRRAVELRAEEWYLLPATPAEIAARVWSAVARAAAAGAAAGERADKTELENMLHDSLTGLPTLPVAIERSRQLFKERGELVVLYLNFVRYSKIEEIYGWEKLDAVLETTASAVRGFLDDDDLRASRVMVSFSNDDDFIFFHVPASGVAAATDGEITEMVTRLQRHVAAQIETAHGEDIAALFDIYVGRAHLYYNPKIRLERVIYRGIREAQNASRSLEQRERARRVSDLKTAIRDRGVYVDYHPIPSGGYCDILGRHSHSYLPGAYVNSYVWDNRRSGYFYNDRNGGSYHSATGVNAPPPGQPRCRTARPPRWGGCAPGSRRPAARRRCTQGRRPAAAQRRPRRRSGTSHRDPAPAGP